MTNTLPSWLTGVVEPEKPCPILIRLDYIPRSYQKVIHNDPCRFKVIVLHRRAGKTVLAIQQLIKDMLTCPYRNPRGAYIAPLYSQAKRVAWQYLQDFTRPIPGMVFNQSELTAILPNGARISLLGADNPDNLRGVYLDSVVMDEFAQMQPRMFSEIIRPALADRKGKALFIGTPQGHNNFYDLYQKASDLKDWSRYLLRWDDTNILDPEEVAAAKAEMQEAEFQQEFECSWSAAIRGAYYAKEMDRAYIGNVPYDSTIPVITSWDLGMSDSTYIWFWQVVGAEIRAINTLEFQSTGLTDIVREIKKLPYTYSQHILPHDVRVRELGTGKSREEVLNGLGVNVTVAPKLPLIDGIDATRNMIPRMYFDEKRCMTGIEALRQYRTDFDDKGMVFKTTPLHNWASHAADSARYFATTRHETGFNTWGQDINYGTASTHI